jgi:hypothetical protein
MDAHGELMLAGRSALTHRRPRQTVCSECCHRARASCRTALALTRVAPSEPAQSLMGQASRAACRFWLGCEATVGLGHDRPRGHFWPIGQNLNRNPFPFHFGLNSSLNFENSYLSAKSSKNHETNSVRFLNSSSIHEKC